MTTEKEKTLAAIRQGQDIDAVRRTLQLASEEMRRDKEVCLAAVKQTNGWAMHNVSEELRGDKDFCLEAFKHYGVSLSHVSEELRGDKDVCLAAVKQNGWGLKYVSEELRGDKDVCLAAVKQDGTALEFVSKELRGDKEFCLETVKQNAGWSLEYVSEELLGDKEVCLESVKQSGWGLIYVSEELRGDKEVCLEAVKQDGRALQFVSEELRGDKDVCLAAAKQSGYALQFVSKELRGDKDVCLAAVKENGQALQFVSKELRGDKEVCLAAVKQSGQALKYVSKELRGDKDVCLAAVKKNGYALQFLSEELRGDKDVCLAAVKQNGEALQFVASKEVCLDAVKQNGEALKYVSGQLRRDKEVCLAAVKQNGEALQFVSSKELRGDKVVCLAAVKQNGEALQFVSSKELRGDKDVCLEAIKKKNGGELFMRFASEEIQQDIDFWRSQVDVLKNYSGGREVLHKWVDVPERKELLKALVEYDPAVAKVKDNTGKLAIDRAIPECKAAMESALCLFGKFKVDDDLPLLHRSRTACVFKAFCRDNKQREEDNDPPDATEQNISGTPVALKCMNYLDQVIAEVKGRRISDGGSSLDDYIIKLQEIYVDKSVPKEDYEKLKKEISTTDDDPTIEILLKYEEDLQVTTKIDRIISAKDIKIKKKNKNTDTNSNQPEEDKDHMLDEQRDTYAYVLVFEYADRTLDAVLTHDRVGSGSHLAKQILEGIGDACSALHANGRIHGDLKPLNIAFVGTQIKLLDLDVSCEIGKSYGTKPPSSGFSPPEVIKQQKQEQLQSFEAQIAHDLFSFGVIMYRIETGEPLWQTDHDDNIVRNQRTQLEKWRKGSVDKKLEEQKISKEAKELLTKLLDPNPVQRCKNYQNDDDELGLDILQNILKKDRYFRHQPGGTEELKSAVNRIEKKVDDMRNELHAGFQNLSDELKNEFRLTRKVLFHAIFEADEVQTPTTFVILPEKLPSIVESPPTDGEKKKDLEDFLADDGSGFLPDSSSNLQKQKKNIEYMKEILTDVTDAKNSIQEHDSNKFFEVVKERFGKLTTENKMYFYLVDELTGEPVQGGKYPIVITEPSKFVPKMMPFIQVGMRAMSLYNGTAGLCRMFGCPIPQVPESMRKSMRESVHILKQKSSVQTFKAVHAKVEDKDEELKTVRGECLRELEDFFKEYDSKKNFAGLRRVCGPDGGAIWTVVRPENEVHKRLEELSKERKDEKISDMNEELIKLKQELEQMKAIKEKDQCQCCIS